MKGFICLLGAMCLAALSLGTNAAQITTTNYDIYIGDLNNDGASDYYFHGKPLTLILHGEIATPILLAPANFALFSSGSSFTAQLYTLTTLDITARIANSTLRLAQFNTDFIVWDNGTSGQSFVLLRGVTNVLPGIMLTSFSSTTLPLITATYSSNDFPNISNPAVKLSTRDMNNDGYVDLLIGDVGTAEGQIAYLADANGIASNSQKIVLSLPANTSPANTHVGSLTGRFRVNESGAATYSMPIAVAEGVAGVKPQIAIDYASQGGAGLVGHGANISGLGAISRCRQTLLHDGVAKAITWGSGDRFCLNGQRLMVTYGSYGSPGSEYKTEVDSFAKITAHGGTTGRPDYFTVEAKDGSKTTYGGIANSKFNVTNGTLSWALSKFEDNVKNRIEYSYEGDKSDGHRIKTITYAFPSSNDTDFAASVDFEYENRLDINSAYVGDGSISKITKRLKNVVSKNGTAIFRKYNFYYNEVNYSTGDQISRLTSAEECTATFCYPKTNFTWGNKITGINSSSQTWLNQLPSSNKFKGYRFFDFNGDGRQDFVWVRGSGTSRYVEYASINKYSSGGMSKKTFSNGNPALSYTIATDNKRSDLLLDIIDYNADGRQDLLICKPINGVGACTSWDLHLSVSDNAGGWRLSHSPIAMPFTGRATRFGDLDSDGVLDAIVFPTYLSDNGPHNVTTYSLKKQTGVSITSNTYYSFSSPSVVPLLGTPPIPPKVEGHNSYDRNKWRAVGYDNISMADFNGDGRLDLVVPIKIVDDSEYRAFSPDKNTQKVYVYVYINNGASFNYSDRFSFFLDQKSYSGQVDLLDVCNVQAIDFNMDGFSDIAASTIVNWHYWKNDGTKSISGGLITDIYSSLDSISSVSFLDYNRDGNTDVIWHDTKNEKLKWRQWNPSTMAFDADQVIFSSKPKSRSYSFADINGDSFPEMVEQKTDSGGNVDIGIFAGNGNESTLDNIYTITDGNNNKTQITYGSLANAINYTTLEGVNSQQVTNPDYCDGWEDETPCVPPVVYSLNTDAFYSAINQPFGAAFEVNNPVPIMEMTAPIYAVTSVSGSAPVAADVNNMNKISYHYHHARIQAGGRGYLGFEKLTTIDQQTGVSTETTYHQDWPFIGSPKSTVVKTKEGKLLSSASNTWMLESDAINSKVKRVFLDVATEVSYALKANGAAQGASLQTSTTNNDYDSDGNVTQIVATTNGGSNTSTKITANTYYGSSGSWKKRMGRLETTTTSTQLNFDPAVVRNTKFEYYAETSNWPGMLHKEIVEPGANQKVTIHQYDAVGNKLSAEVTAYVKPGVSQTRKTTYDYDDSRRYLETTKDSLDNIVSGVIHYHPIHGLPTEIRDINGVITYISYLDDGREKQRRDSIGAWTQTDQGFCSSNVITCPLGAHSWVRTLVSGGGKTIEFVDMVGRAIRSAKVMFDGRESQVDTEYDNLGRVLRKSEPYFTGDTIYWSVFEYDILGRATKITAPNSSITTSTYDGDSYKTEVTNALQQKRIEERNGLGQLVKVTDHLQGTISYVYDVLGNLTSATTVSGNKTVKVQMCYDSLGRKIAMHDPDKGGFLGNATETCAAVAEDLDSPVAEKLSGWWFYKYNDFGELIEQTDTKKQVTKMDYDELGRMRTRSDYFTNGNVDTHTRWYYDKYLGESIARTETQRKLTAVVTSYGAINESCAGNNYCQTYLYDSAARVTDTVTYLPGGSVGYINSTRFDAIGRVTYNYDVLKGLVSSNSGTRTLYNDYGYAREIRDVATGDVLQKTIAVNARGQTKEEWRNNGGAGTVTYIYDDKTGLLKNQKAVIAGGLFPIQDVAYEWDTVGNLKSRWNQSSNVGRTAKKNLRESFCYDGLNRLIKSHQGTLTGSCSLTASNQDVEYDGLGNIARKTGVGIYDYTGKGPHAVTSTTSDGIYSYDNNGNQIGGANRSITYSSYDQPTQITKGTTTTEFKYAPDRSRWERVDTKSGVKTTTHYLGNVERIEVENSGVVEWKRYVAGAVYTVRTTISGGIYAIQSTDKSFIYNDHLGSLDVVVNHLGQVTHTASFDAWGNRRSGENWTAAFAASSLNLASFTQPVTKRGYTGHEMLDDTGLIHMNGRIYDPRLARFMQADPFIQAATNTQSYNRYSYVLNNPLNMTDPSGYFFEAYLFGKYVLRPLFKAIGYENSQLLIAVGSMACLGAAPICVAYGTYHLNRAYGVSPGESLISAGFAGLTAITFQAAGAIANGNPYIAFVAAGTIGGALAEVQGGKFGNGFIAAGIGAAAGVKFNSGWQGLLAATVAGGTASEITGGKFANGAASAAFSYAAMWGASKIGAGGSNYGAGEPDDARETYWANREDLDLKVVDGVLVGEVDVGCKVNTSQCSAAFDTLEKVNQPGKVNIKFNRHTVYENNSALDIEIKFTTFDGGGLEKTMGVYTRGTKGGLFSKGSAATIRLDYTTIGHAQQQGIILHEFGHAMGHVHMKNFTNSIMSYSPNARNNFTDLELNAIKRAYQ